MGRNRNTPDNARLSNYHKCSVLLHSDLYISTHVRDFVIFMAASSLIEIIGIEHFIAEVKNYPEILNSVKHIYHDRIKKRLGWINICRIFTK